MTKEDEVRKAKIAAPPIPPNVRGKKIKVKIVKEQCKFKAYRTNDRLW